MKRKKRKKLCRCCLKQINGKPAGFVEGFDICVECSKIRGRLSPEPWRQFVRDCIREAAFIEGITKSPLEDPTPD